jgi:hypothetical protein
MRATLALGGMAGLVEFQEAVKDLLPDRRANRVAGALAGVVEGVGQAGG